MADNKRAVIRSNLGPRCSDRGTAKEGHDFTFNLNSVTSDELMNADCKIAGFEIVPAKTFMTNLKCLFHYEHQHS